MVVGLRAPAIFSESERSISGMTPVFGAVKPRILRIEGAFGCGASECSLFASEAIGAAQVFRCFAFFRRKIFLAFLII